VANKISWFIPLMQYKNLFNPPVEGGNFLKSLYFKKLHSILKFLKSERKGFYNEDLNHVTLIIIRNIYCAPNQHF